MTDTTKVIGLEAYNDFQVFSKLSYGCIKYLMNNNELVWKLLKYSGPDAWKEDDLTQAEKAALIYAGQQDTADYHIFMDSKQPDVYVDETTILRISPTYAVGLDRVLGYIEVSMEIFSHYKINHLSNYQTRVDTIAEELLGLFNGVNIQAGEGLVGNMAFNKMIDTSARLFEIGQIPFGGKQIIFTTFTA